MRILVAEDEVRLAEALEHILKKEKYMTDVVHDGQDALEYGLSGIYDMIIMDVMMPKKTGFQATAELRRAGIDTPILMLTAKSDVENKVEGLDCGADDYMTKPFASQELLARIRAITRRKGEVLMERLAFGDLSLDLAASSLSVGEKITHLSFKEFEIMKRLMAGTGSVIGKEELLVKIWGYEGDATENNVEAYISFLRKKLRFLGSSCEITALRKIGYRLEDKNN